MPFPFDKGGETPYPLRRRRVMEQKINVASLNPYFEAQRNLKLDSRIFLAENERENRQAVSLRNDASEQARHVFAQGQ